MRDGITGLTDTSYHRDRSSLTVHIEIVLFFRHSEKPCIPIFVFQPTTSYGRIILHASSRLKHRLIRDTGDHLAATDLGFAEKDTHREVERISTENGRKSNGRRWQR